MPPVQPPSLVQHITKCIHNKYLGSEDVEVPDSIDFCAYFEANYGDEAGKARLKDKFMKLQQDLERATRWQPAITAAS